MKKSNNKLLISVLKMFEIRYSPFHVIPSALSSFAQRRSNRSRKTIILLTATGPQWQLKGYATEVDLIPPIAESVPIFHGYRVGMQRVKSTSPRVDLLKRSRRCQLWNNIFLHPGSALGNSASKEASKKRNMSRDGLWARTITIPINENKSNHHHGLLTLTTSIIWTCFCESYPLPNMNPSNFIDLTWVGEDGVERRLAQPKHSGVIDLTEDSPPPEPQKGVSPQSDVLSRSKVLPRMNFMESEHVPPRSPLQRTSVPPQGRAPMPDSSPIDKLRQPKTSLNDIAEPSPPPKFSLQSASERQNVRPHGSTPQHGGAQKVPPSQIVIPELFDSADDESKEAQDVPENLGVGEEQNGLEDRDTPSRQASRGVPLPQAGSEDADVLEEQDSLQSSEKGSERSPRLDLSPQKSFDRSTGTDSPLATRIRGEKARKAQEENRARRAESPREVMARRSRSTDQDSNVHYQNIVDLEERLNEFQQRVHDDHAETVKWLLHDARRVSTQSVSPFIDDICPFTSMKPVNALSEQAFKEMTKLKMETIVSFQAHSRWSFF